MHLLPAALELRFEFIHLKALGVLVLASGAFGGGGAPESKPQACAPCLHACLHPQDQGCHCTYKLLQALTKEQQGLHGAQARHCQGVVIVQDLQAPAAAAAAAA